MFYPFEICYVCILTKLIEKKPVLLAQLCPTCCNPMNCSPPGASVHGILQARILEWIVISFSRGSFQPRDQIRVSHIVGRFFTMFNIGGVLLVAQLCPTPYNPVDCSLPGASVHGILQARILEWVAIPF